MRSRSRNTKYEIFTRRLARRSASGGGSVSEGGSLGEGGRNTKPSGFTMIELLIVVSVIAFMAAIIFAVFQQTSKAHDSKRKSQLAQLKTVLEDYYNDNGCYPPQSALDCEDPNGLRPYISRVPCDPKGISYIYEVDPGYGQAESSCPRWFRIYTNFENLSDLDIAKTGCNKGCGPPSLNYPYTYGVSSDNIGLENDNCTPRYYPSSGGTGCHDDATQYNVCRSGEKVCYCTIEQCLGQN